MRPPIGVMTAAAIAAVMLSACGRDAEPVPTGESARVAQGGELYEQHCASCHRSDLSGDPDWKTPNEDGSYPPPPHDASGHTWHHSDRVLIEIVRDGSDFPRSRMPVFGDRLSDDEIDAILEFIKAGWGPQERAYQQEITELDESRPPE